LLPESTLAKKKVIGTVGVLDSLEVFEFMSVWSPTMSPRG
jgi:hypothetical protein